MDNTNVKKSRAPKKMRTWRFNVLDAIILTLIVLIIVGAVAVLLPTTTQLLTGSDSVNITYTVVFNKVDETLAANIADGQNVTDRESGRLLGTVVGTPSIESYWEFVLKEDGNGSYFLEREQYPDIGKVNIAVTFTAEAKYSDGVGYTVNGVRIATDREYSMLFPEFEGIGSCSMVTVTQN